ncbi:MAG: CPBP family intramembrane metalloprotease [Ignavibacteriales bacterium]|nr:CPBP family intramembrane metalloprotease [Ignavibacteriales bacterium]
MDWKGNLIWFLFPAVVYGLIILTGDTTNQGEIDDLDNWITLILATLFDLPVVFFFSTTSVFIEEAFFRGIIFNSLNSTKEFLHSALYTSMLYSIFSMADAFSFDFSSILIFISLLLYFASVGFLASILVLKYNSLWTAYSFRIGLLTITPLILTSYLAESDSFFKTKNSFFYAEGLIFSILIFGIGFLLLKSTQKIGTPSKFENSTV